MPLRRSSSQEDFFGARRPPNRKRPAPAQFQEASVWRPADTAPGPVSAEDEALPVSATTAVSAPPRLLSLDALRGLTIAVMLLVNNILLGAQTPATLLHAGWTGRVHLADLVFPFFLFVAGVALPYSRSSSNLKQYLPRILWRAVLLVGLGCVIDSFLAHRPVFDLGVLQITGLAYLCAILLGSPRQMPNRLTTASLLLLVYWVILKAVPIPGVGAGVFTREHNVILWLNETYLGQWNLKGLLSLFPTTALVLLGAVGGEILQRAEPSGRDRRDKGKLLAGYSAQLIAAGMVGCHPLLGVLALPMNKPTWTPSYVLFTAGWACCGLAALYLYMDAPKYRTVSPLLSPLLVLGTNAIVAYVAPILLKVAILRNIMTTWPTGRPLDLESGLRLWFNQQLGFPAGGWAYAIAYIAFWWVLLFLLYRRHYFLKA